MVTMNLSILNKTKNYIVIYDAFENVILKHNYVKGFEKPIWSFLSIPNSYSENFSDFLYEKYDILINELNFVGNELINRNNYLFFKKKGKIRNLRSNKKLDVFEFPSILGLTLHETVLNTISQIFEIIVINKDASIKKLENNLCNIFSFKKKNDRVFYSNTSPSKFSIYQGKLLKEVALIKKLPIIRLCLHNNDREHINEMLIVHSQPQLVGPLKQNNKNSMSYLALDGKATIKQYDSNNNEVERIKISSQSTCSQFCRIDPSLFRTIESHSKYFIFLEICSGPFKDEDTIWGNVN